jgi:hypothetical protein
VLATSSPLYQPTDGAEAIGYEVHVYARVPDTGDGADRIRRPGHTPKNSFGTATGDNGSNGNGDSASPSTTSAAGHSPVRPRGHKHSKSYSGSVSQSLPTTGTLANIKTHSASTTAVGGTAAASSTPNGGRVKYREQGVDELIQLKLHQALAAAPEPLPSGATIVLATGDGNVGQFNEEGFLGCVRTALRRGWRVELYAWDEGLSRAWRREFGEEEKFKIIALEPLAADLLEPDGHTGV